MNLFLEDEGIESFLKNATKNKMNMSGFNKQITISKNVFKTNKLNDSDPLLELSALKSVSKKSDEIYDEKKTDENN